MSSNVMRWVSSMKLSAARRNVLMRFAESADDEGISCVSIARIADRAGIAYDTARYHVRNLKRLGLLVSTERAAQPGGGRLAAGTQVSNGWKVVGEGETKAAAMARLVERNPCSSASLFPGKMAPDPAPLNPDERPLQAEVIDIVRQASKAIISRGAPVQNCTPLYMNDDYISTGKRKTLKGKKKKEFSPGELELEAMREGWNRLLIPKGYPRFVRITEAFKKKLAARRAEPGFSWAKIIRILSDDKVRPFFLDELHHPSGWITAQWVVNGVSNYERILSGKYHLVGTDIDDDLEAGDWAAASEQAKERRVNVYDIERELDELR